MSCPLYYLMECGDLKCSLHFTIKLHMVHDGIYLKTNTFLNYVFSDQEKIRNT